MRSLTVCSDSCALARSACKLSRRLSSAVAASSDRKMTTGAQTAVHTQSPQARPRPAPVSRLRSVDHPAHDPARPPARPHRARPTQKAPRDWRCSGSVVRARSSDRPPRAVANVDDPRQTATCTDGWHRRHSTCSSSRGNWSPSRTDATDASSVAAVSTAARTIAAFRSEYSDAASCTAMGTRP